MIQQVNLYTQELRPQKERLQAGTLAGLVMLALLAVAVAAGMVRHEAAELDERVDAMVAENLRLEQRITDLSAQVQARQPSPDIREALDRVTATLVRRERVLERVENLVLTGGGRFSPQMAALARHCLIPFCRRTVQAVPWEGPKQSMDSIPFPAITPMVFK